MLNITKIDLTTEQEDPFEFVSKILDMDLATQMEIFPEVGSTTNIFKYYTYAEAKEKFEKWYKGEE